MLPSHQKNMKTKILILALISTLIMGCQKTKKTNAMNNEYEWNVSINAPKNFPATIYYASLDGVEMRRDGTIDSGWGMSGSSSEGLKTIPKRLDIIWISYIENQFYKGNFLLNQEKIKQIFEEGFLNDVRDGITRFHNFEFVVNVAPGGTVALFMKGLGGFQREVGFFKAEKTEVTWKHFVPMGNQNRKDFVAVMLEDVDKDSLAHYKTNGIPFDRWENYREYFSLKTTMPPKYKIDGLVYDSFNGERYYGENNAYHINEDYNKLPIPKEIIINWIEKDNDAYKYISVLNIKESEYTKMSDFLKKHDNKADFYIEPYILINVREINLFLKSETEKIEIELLPYIVKRRLLKF